MTPRFVSMEELSPPPPHLPTTPVVQVVNLLLYSEERGCVSISEASSCSVFIPKFTYPTLQTWLVTTANDIPRVKITNYIILRLSKYLPLPCVDCLFFVQIPWETPGEISDSVVTTSGGNFRSSR